MSGSSFTSRRVTLFSTYHTLGREKISHLLPRRKREDSSQYLVRFSGLILVGIYLFGVLRFVCARVRMMIYHICTWDKALLMTTIYYMYLSASIHYTYTK